MVMPPSRQANLWNLGGEGSRCYPLQFVRVQPDDIESEHACDATHDVCSRQWSKDVSRGHQGQCRWARPARISDPIARRLSAQLGSN